MINAFRIFLFLITLHVYFYNHSQAQVTNPEQVLTNIDSELIWAQTLEGSHFNEFWNYHFYLENDIILHIVFNAANFGGLKDPVSGIRVSVYNLDDKIYQLSREYQLDMLIQDKENQRFQVRPEREIFFEGLPPDAHRVRIFTTKNDVSYDIDLEFKNMQPGFKVGNGKFGINNETIGILTHIPYAEVTGTVAVNDSKTHVSGTGYMDHTFQDQTTSKLIKKGFRFIHHTDKDNWDLTYFMLPNDSDQNQTIGYRAVNQNGEMRVQSDFKIDRLVENEVFGHQVARLTELKFNNQNIIRLVRAEDHEKFSILDELSWLARRAAKTFLGGEVIDFRGKATLMESGHRPVRGYYNYFIVD